MTYDQIVGCVMLVCFFLLVGFYLGMWSQQADETSKENAAKRATIMQQRQQHSATFDATSAVILELDLANTPNAFGCIYHAVKVAIESYEAKRAT